MGIVFAIVSAITQSLKGLSEKIATKHYSPLQIATRVSLIELPIIAVITLVGGRIPWHISLYAVGVIIIVGVVNAITRRTTAKALSCSPLGMVLPLFGLVPVFTTILGQSMLGESPSWVGWMGVSVVSGGTLLLHWHRGWSVKRVLTGMISEPGSRLMMINAILRSFTNILMKEALTEMNPRGMLFGTNLVIVILLYSASKRKGISLKITRWKLIGTTAIFNMISFVSMLMAYEYLLVGYVSSIKRLSGLFAMVRARYALKEKQPRSRIVGGMCIVGGCTMIVLS